mmetsp:Transcript_32228/g.75031  ORF Transcript_32228/g.75031 Transcript_32228/m.75031 type:complete len:342 (+) Transcript_32228:132-1157(+)
MYRTPPRKPCCSGDGLHFFFWRTVVILLPLFLGVAAGSPQRTTGHSLEADQGREGVPNGCAHDVTGIAVEQLPHPRVRFEDPPRLFLPVVAKAVVEHAGGKLGSRPVPLARANVVSGGLVEAGVDLALGAAPYDAVGKGELVALGGPVVELETDAVVGFAVAQDAFSTHDGRKVHADEIRGADLQDKHVAEDLCLPQGVGDNLGPWFCLRVIVYSPLLRANSCLRVIVHSSGDGRKTALHLRNQLVPVVGKGRKERGEQRLRHTGLRVNAVEGPEGANAPRNALPELEEEWAGADDGGDGVEEVVVIEGDFGEDRIVVFAEELCSDAWKGRIYICRVVFAE